MSSLPLQNAPRNLCVLRLSAIGDVCHTLPVVRRLQDHWPDTRLTWVIGRTEHALLSSVTDIEFIVVDKKDMPASIDVLKKQVAGRSFDALLHMQVALRASRLARHIPTDIRLGYDRDRARDFQGLFTTHRIQARPREHVMQALQGFADALGAAPRPPRWDIPVPPESRADVAAAIQTQRPYIVMVPCASQRARNYRDWPSGRYQAVARHAMQRHDLTVVLAGGPTELERETADRIAQGVQGNIVNLVGQTSLPGMLALLDGASALIAPDTGPVHMAGTVGTPVIGLYASSNPARTGPIDPRFTINKYPEALHADCGKTVEQARWGQRVRDPQVMLSIEVDEVCQMLDWIMQQPGTD